ncbi:MAG: GNAT family N-acetyltransferase [Nocardioidaceae bacterium]
MPDSVIPIAADPARVAVVVAARASAQRAADQGGIVVRALDSLENLRAAETLFSDVWQPANGVPPMDHDLLHALVDTGSCYAAGAFDKGVLLGACVGFWSRPDDRRMHSHLAGVASAHRGRLVGYSLKLDQRAHALENSVDTVTWTFDPLTARNAHLNLHKLGARPVSYRVNFYGTLVDQLNGVDESDRFLVHWDLASPDVQSRCDQASPVDHTAGVATVAALTIDADQAPHVVNPVGAEVVTVAIPPSIEDLRRTRPGLAQEWRAATRAVFMRLSEDGAQIVDFDRANGEYVVKTPAR